VIHVKAFVLLNVEPGWERSVIDAFKAVKDIKGVSSLYGAYDVIVEIEDETVDEVRLIVFNKVRRLDHVNSTLTLLTYGEPVINE